ncbi:hypothetical protein E2562_017014 [Oryza meyeriana var. granulata]|uniref:Uncharacterized protein n=1 Tax=Oryza meyeriana var. granulata TaxID=110450 RepID=A0A6G1EAI1_9ORYZ|nr:hypothetical protein E2562_017014 [Oryza meyeriana var. granulata]
MAEAGPEGGGSPCPGRPGVWGIGEELSSSLLLLIVASKGTAAVPRVGEGAATKLWEGEGEPPRRQGWGRELLLLSGPQRWIRPPPSLWRPDLVAPELQTAGSGGP